MLRTLRSFLTAHCPNCYFRRGARCRKRSGDRLLGFCFIYPFECHSCNVRYHAIHFSAH